MSERKPNLIFISVDALRYDRLSVNGYDRPTSPTLERLGERSLICENHFALNASTMGAFPTVMCSSRPLSHGGFDSGVENRPANLFRQFQNAGYNTYMLSTVHWVNRFFGYGDGVSSEEMLFSLGSVIGTAGALTRTTLERYNDGLLGAAEMRAHIQPILTDSFDRLEAFAIERKARCKEDRQNFRYAPFFADAFNYDRVLETIERHRRLLAEDAEGYFAKYLPKPFRATGWLTPEWKNARTLGRLAEEGMERILGQIIGVANPKKAFLRRQRYKRYPDAESLARHIVSRAAGHDGDQPFMIWTHLFDTHLPYCAGAQPKWYRNTPKHLSALNYDTSIDPGATFGTIPKTAEGKHEWQALYDAAVHFIDGALAKLMEGLKQAGLEDNTIIAICGDHGEELGENGDFGHHFRLYEYNTHVPFMIWGPGIEGQRVSSLTTHLDLAPTLTDLAGVQANHRWEGVPVQSSTAAARDHILMETFYGSPCDFDNRPLYFGVRGKDFHLMWKEHRDPTDRLSPESNQLYDVHADPKQLNNIYDENHPHVLSGKRIIAERMSELPELDESRYPNLSPDPAKALGK